jgi:hypothetical protein
VISTLPRGLSVPRHNRPLALLVMSTLLLAFAGSVWSALVLVQGIDEDTRRANAAGVGQFVDTSYGRLKVDYVEHINGLSDEDMGGAMPSMPGMVHADSEEVIAYVTLINDRHSPLELSPAQFQLITDSSDTPVPGSGTPLGTGDVQPGSALETSFRFVIPRDEAHLWLEYRDPGNSSSLRVALGTAREAPADGEAGHTH